jgi:hypothetical protein
METPIKTLPVFELILSEDTDESSGVSVVSFVTEPAIGKNFQYFSKNPKQIKFSVDEDRRITTGPLLIPGLEIYRNVPIEHKVVINKQNIELAAKKFFKTNRVNNVNAEHETLLLNGVYLYESFITDSSRGVLAPLAFKDVPDGTWFMSYNVESDEIWENVKNGTFAGYSIEGLFSQIPIKMNVRNEMQRLHDLYSSIMR